MITGQLRSRIDKLWEEFWTGGVTNPLTVIEQISFLMFAQLLDMRESTEEKKFDRVNRGKKRKFPGVFFRSNQQHMRWSQFKHRGGDEMLKIIRDELFPHFRNLGSSSSLSSRGEGRGEGSSKTQQVVTYTGDLITPQQWKHIQTGLFHGFDFDVTMLRIAAMNLMLHGVDTPDIHYQDTLSNNFPEKFPKMASNAFDLILANPPFKGSLDYSDVHSSLTGKVKTKKTELLFITLMLRMLKLGGRCAVIVPDGVMFGSSNAHKELRKMLVEENQLEAVIKLPSGVFRPYAGVSTAILLFTKGGQTDNVFFFDVQADGKTLDDKRDKIGADDDWQDLDVLRDAWPKWNGGAGKKYFKDRTANAFFAPKSEIEENAFDLSINRYKEIVHEEEQYDSPKVILGRLKKLEAEIASDLEELEAMLG